MSEDRWSIETLLGNIKMLQERAGQNNKRSKDGDEIQQAGTQKAYEQKNYDRRITDRRRHYYQELRSIDGQQFCRATRSLYQRRDAEKISSALCGLWGIRPMIILSMVEDRVTAIRCPLNCFVTHFGTV